MKTKVEALGEELKRVINEHIYSFEIDTEDIVFGFKKTLKKRTRNLAKALSISSKLSRDCGQMISASVQIKAVRFYNDGKLLKEIN